MELNNNKPNLTSFSDEMVEKFDCFELTKNDVFLGEDVRATECKN